MVDRTVIEAMTLSDQRRQILVRGGASPRHVATSAGRLIYSENVAQLWTLPLEERDGQWKAGTPERASASGFTEAWPSFSPDGRWLAYESNESGREEGD